jgi:hypothetical protein
MHRRELLRLLAVGAGAKWLEGLAPEQVLAFGQFIHGENADRLSTTAARDLRTLDPHMGATVTAATEQIIPASDTPGATDAGVTAFIDRMLSDWYSPEERDRLLAGLRELDARARALHECDFIDCDEPAQVQILSALDGEVEGLRSAPVRDSNPNNHWFAMLKYLTVWGYCTSEPAMRQTLGAHPLPLHYEACAPHEAGSQAGAP